MNQRVTPPVLATTRRGSLVLSLLLPALAIEVAPSTAPPTNRSEETSPFHPKEKTRPYLQAIGAPPLRFQEAIPPPDLSARPGPGSPPKPSVKATADIIKLPSLESAGAASPAAQAAPAKSEIATPKTPGSSAESTSTPSAILPDDIKHRASPEDFLPFFQFPGASVPPLPGRQPPSSATYKQQ
jgi:hypothetical protein